MPKRFCSCGHTEAVHSSDDWMACTEDCGCEAWDYDRDVTADWVGEVW